LYVKCINYGALNVAINCIDVAGQIAYLLNNNNNLRRTHNSSTILKSNDLYLVELWGSTVIGCVALSNIANVDKIIHLSVLSTVQGRGIGYKLLRTAIDTSFKETIYMQVRNDNTKSLNLAYMNGFKVVSCIEKLNYSIFNLYLFNQGVKWNLQM